MKALRDTNICIYLIKEHPPAIRRRFANFAPGEIGVSAVTIAELQDGVEKSAAKERNKAALAAFLLPFEYLPFDAEAAQTYGAIRTGLERKGLPIGPLDLLIAAQAVSRNLLLVTHNLREFKRIPNLQCESWM
jgi:tRNA(fMet)-specific endonuclease VapC